MPEYVDLKGRMYTEIDRNDVESSHPAHEVATRAQIKETSLAIQSLIGGCVFIAGVYHVVITSMGYEALQGKPPEWWSEKEWGVWDPLHFDRNFYHMYYVTWLVCVTIARDAILVAYVLMARAIVFQHRRFTAWELVLPIIVGFGAAAMISTFFATIVRGGEMILKVDCVPSDPPVENDHCRDGRKVAELRVVFFTFASMLVIASLFMLGIAVASWGTATCSVLRAAFARALTE